MALIILLATFGSILSSNPDFTMTCKACNLSSPLFSVIVAMILCPYLSGGFLVLLDLLVGSCGSILFVFFLSVFSSRVYVTTFTNPCFVCSSTFLATCLSTSLLSSFFSASVSVASLVCLLSSSSSVVSSSVPDLLDVVSTSTVSSVLSTSSELLSSYHTSILLSVV